MSDEQGATGASPSPSTGVNTGSSPSTTATAPTQSPAQAGKGREYVAKMREAAARPEVENKPAEVSDEEFWKTHGDRIFKHDRFRELTEAKKALTPYQEFVESVGGLEQAQLMNQYLGPVWQKISQDPDGGRAFWEKMYPIFSAFLSGQDYNSLFNAQQAQQEVEVEEDPYAEKIKPVQTELERVKQELEAQKLQMQQRSQREQEQYRQNTLRQYLSAVDKRIASSEGSIPEDMRQEIAEIMGPRMAAFMPKHRGQPVHPLDVYSEEAFDACWNAVVEPLVKKMTGAALSKAKTVINKGGPVLPDTNTFGKTAVGQGTPMSLNDKKARFAQMLRGT